MKKQLFGFLRTNRKGLALISVLGVVTLATILILALFSVSDAEFKAAKNYSDGATARHLADSAVNLVISQIQAGATGAGVAGSQSVANRTTWASQPGAIRVYRTNGEFAKGRRLYSSDRMVIDDIGPNGESLMARDAPAADWDKNPAEWVNLNDPVVKVASTGGEPKVIFPIVDPRAAKAGNGMEAIEGFSYSSKTITNADLAGVVSSGELDDLRLPMPVRWLYVLKDGSMGTVSSSDGSEGKWNGVEGAGRPSEQNPIIGRMAFWTDDECSRVNINTAGEPGQFATPTVFNVRDAAWANNQPVWREYQRYPGHPATVALSSILYPNPTHDPTKYDADGYSGIPTHPKQVIQLKSAISLLVPKLGHGASEDGTIPYAPDDFVQTSSPTMDALKAEHRQVSRKHLFASVDEWIFANMQVSDTSRDLVSSGPAGKLISPDILERGRFFLTAHSKGSELNMFGMPRVAIWPVPDADLGPDFRTGFDATIAYASSLGSAFKDTGGISTNSYYFSRRDANSAIEDIGGGTQSKGLVRNKNLMSYLDYLVSEPKMPGGGTFRTKYGEDDSRQILVEIFDYIRITNLYDAFLDDLYVKKRNNKRDLWDDGNEPGAIKYTRQQDLWLKKPEDFTYYTYTAPRFDTIRRVADLGGIVPVEFRDQYVDKQMTTGAYPGHGQVRPIEWTVGGKTYKGFGRFPTISEVALQFICTGDGKNGPGSFRVPGPGNTEILSGGKTAQKIDPTIEAPANPRTGYSTAVDNDGNPLPSYWYSNIPPFPAAKLFEEWGMSMAQANTGGPLDPMRHPAMNPMNWNCTLDWTPGKGGIALKENEKRVQMVMQLELFVPAVGYTKYIPDFTIVLDGKELGNFQVERLNPGTGLFQMDSVFNTTGDLVVQSTVAYNGSALGEAVTGTNVTPLGGSYGTTPLMSGRQSKSGGGKMPDDPGYVSSATGDPHAAMLNFPLVSSYFTIDRDKPIKFKAPKSPLKIDIYAAHDWKGNKSKKNTTPTQTVYLALSDGEVPAPWLVVHSSEYWKFVDNNGNLFERRSVHAPRWWSFTSAGAVQRYEGRGVISGAAVSWSGVKEHVYAEGKELDTRGRFAGTGHTLTQTKKTDGSTVNVPSQLQLFGYSPLANFRGVKSNPERDLVNADVFQPAGLLPGKKIGMGDYGFWGTDSVRSMVPSHGDYRLLAARPQVPATVWVKHRVWQERPDDLFAHSLMGAQSNYEVGVDIGNGKNDALDTGGNPVPVQTNRLISAWYPENQVPDTPLTAAARLISSGRGDFDNGMGDIRDGAYINKADDGNLSVDQEWYGTLKQFYTTRNSYFKSSFLQVPSKGSYFTPNRMLSSPVVFGSLPTGVYGSGTTNPDQQKNGVPWRTLLFRSDPALTHYGNGIVSPADHNLLDLFWMPVIEPYAISDSFASAGKVNMNYQMVPFTHIQRKTALHAVLKGELVTAFSQNDVAAGAPNRNNTLIYKRFKKPNTAPPEFWGDGDIMQWHRKVNINSTLNQFDERFSMAATPRAGTLSGLFRTASQICELDILPKSVQARQASGEPAIGNYTNDSTRKGAMVAFWNHNKLTGDNTRERTYSNIYQKLTTRSNSYRVYFMAQAIKKAKSVSPDMINMNKDTVTGEYRGSALVDRFLDFSAAERGTAPVAFPDYADGRSPFSKPSLETFYHFRILEMKQFSP